MFADLHIHTTFSDGIYTPQQIVEQALKADISAMAITDHDNTAAYKVAQNYIQEKKYRLKLIRGVEIDTIYSRYTVHVLGYHFDAGNAQLQEKLTWTSQGRIQRMETMVQKLRDHHYDITMEEVQVAAAGSNSIGRPHVARVMVEKKYFPTVAAVFDTLLKRGKPCYVEQEKLTPVQAVETIHQAGGIAVLAHPSEVNDYQVVVELLKAINFDGLEVWHPSAREQEQWRQWRKLAQKYELLTSGGSDFHGDPHRFPSVLGGFPVKYENVEQVINFHR